MQAVQRFKQSQKIVPSPRQRQTFLAILSLSISNFGIKIFGIRGFRTPWVAIIVGSGSISLGSIGLISPCIYYFFWSTLGWLLINNGYIIKRNESWSEYHITHFASSSFLDILYWRYFTYYNDDIVCTKRYLISIKCYT